MRTLTIILSILLLACKEQPKQPVIEQSLQEKIVAKEVTDVTLSSGKLIRVENFPSKHVQARNVDVWLPENYSKDKKYKVLYMHDGQMLFDATTTWNKQEWKVDETAATLLKEGKVHDFIVVALWNISEIRWQDYFPEKAFSYLDEHVQKKLKEDAKQENFSMQLNADEYLKFITEEVKPYIDATYPTLSQKEHTFISGSSMGGLISMYAMCEYPEIFSAAACISTHWPGMLPKKDNPIPKAFFAYMKEHLPSSNTHKFYFDYGTETLDQHYPQYADEVDALFKAKGYTSANFVNRKFEGTDHSENSWNQRLHIPITFLLEK